MPEKRYWGKHGEYGPYSAQADGWPNRGEVLRAWRKNAKMSAKYVGEQYGIRVNGQPVSERWVTMAEKYNLVPKDEGRRRILAEIVGIPPILFGLGTLKDLQPAPAQHTAATTTDIISSLTTDTSSIKQYDKFLNLLWKLDYTSTAQDSLTDIEAMIADLHALAPKVTGSEQVQVYELLCGFYPLASTIYNDQRNHAEAFTYADKGVTLADNMHNNKMRAVALYQRGFISLQRGMVEGDQVDQTYINAAITDLEKAIPLAIPRLEAAIWLDLGLAHALIKQRRAANSDLDKAGRIMTRRGLEDGTFVDLFANIDKGRYHLGRAATLIALKEFDEAESDLDIADEKISADQTRRHAWIDVLRAKVYYGQGSFSVATETALNALKVCKSINSTNNINLIQGLHAQLSNTNYAMAKPVRELGAALILP